jgi:hypothetical protein
LLHDYNHQKAEFWYEIFSRPTNNM